MKMSGRMFPRPLASQPGKKAEAKGRRTGAATLASSAAAMPWGDGGEQWRRGVVQLKGLLAASTR